MYQSNNYTLITGASGHLGRAYINKCIKENWNVFLTGRNNEDLEQLSNQIKKEHANIQVLHKVCDVSREEDRKNLLDYIKDNNIKVNRLILNAGVMTEGAFLDYQNAEYMDVVDTNCAGNIDIFYKIASVRDKNERLYVIVVSSLATLNPMPQMAVYAASKTFLTSFFVAVRDELKHDNVYITVVCPSGMATTKAMVAAIKSQGICGRLTLNTVESIANKSINKNLKNKPILVVGAVNKFLRLVCVIAPQTFRAHLIGNRWRKTQKKNTFKTHKCQ